MTYDEIKILEAYKKMKEIYPNDDLMIINPKSYRGYNIQTGNKIVLKEWEVLDD